MDFLAGLNPQQREAVAHVEGPLLLLAGAGSGKTRVITHRIAHLIDCHRVPAAAILAVTFTNKAADEMRQRVHKLLGTTNPSQPATISTFHAFCVRLLRRDGDALAEIRNGFTRQFTIYDDDDQLTLLKSIYKQLGLDEKFMPYRTALSRISHGKNHRQLPQEWYHSATDPQMLRLAKIYELYEERLRQANALDFDDLLLESVRLLRHDDALRQLYNRRYEFVMIDEYQDTNRSQYELMRLLTEMHHNICVVGDEDQSIYGWRGADIRNILDFQRDFPNAKVIRLEQNYRSTKNILDAASAVVANNKQRMGKWLWTNSGAGAKIGYYEAPDGENEALFIADTIEKLLTDHPDERIAVLYRTNFQSRQIEEALRRYGRKYSIVGGFSFYQRAEVKDLLAYLKIALSPQDSLSLLRIINTPARGIGKGTIEQIERYALEHNLSLWHALPRMLEEKILPVRAESAIRSFLQLIEELRESVQTKPLHEALRDILERTGYETMLKSETTPDAESRLGNLNELVNAAAEAVERGETASEFLDHAALVSDADAVDEQASVSLLTIHNAKGLEFPTVFLAGMEEGLFPHSRSFASEAAMEEERRLCYVGMTRAEKRLYVSWARFRRRFGSNLPEPCLPSRFLNEIPSSLREQFSPYRKPYEGDVDLFAEQHDVRESVKRNLYTGRTYNSIENIAQFFAERGMPVPSSFAQKSESRRQAPPSISSNTPKSNIDLPKANPQPKNLQTRAATGNVATGTVIDHPKYGRGTVLRREGEGDNAKLTISFPGYGLKKIVEKYAGIKVSR
jgi:DNA helicase-2/ATP-dependent DNA helicase PcrA